MNKTYEPSKKIQLLPLIGIKSQHKILSKALT